MHTKHNIRPITVKLYLIDVFRNLNTTAESVQYSRHHLTRQLLRQTDQVISDHGQVHAVMPLITVWGRSRCVAVVLFAAGDASLHVCKLQSVFQ